MEWIESFIASLRWANTRELFSLNTTPYSGERAIISSKKEMDEVQ